MQEEIKRKQRKSFESLIEIFIFPSLQVFLVYFLLFELQISKFVDARLCFLDRAWLALSKYDQLFRSLIGSDEAQSALLKLHRFCWSPIQMDEFRKLKLWIFRTQNEEKFVLFWQSYTSFAIQAPIILNRHSLANGWMYGEHHKNLLPFPFLLHSPTLSTNKQIVIFWNNNLLVRLRNLSSLTGYNNVLRLFTWNFLSMKR